MPRLPKAEHERRQLEAVAYHEAGHAVMAIEYRRAIHSVSIVPDPDAGSLGHVRFQKRYQPVFSPEWSDLRDAPCQTICIREVLVALAGPAAEEHFTGRPCIGPGGDYGFVDDLAERVCEEDEQKPFVEWLKLRSRRETTHSRNWVRVEALARALLLKLKLSVAEAIEVCELASIAAAPEEMRAGLLELRARRAAAKQKRAGRPRRIHWCDLR
jgi:ATP-dependent Zn protease